MKTEIKRKKIQSIAARGDTPDTSALIDGLCPYLETYITIALEEFARKLERQRNEAIRNECHHGWRGTKPENGERIQTPCPECGCRSLFIGSGGHLTCARVPTDRTEGCSNPGVEDAVNALKSRAESAEREVEALRRGEYICKKCGLRKDADTTEADF